MSHTGESVLFTSTFLLHTIELLRIGCTSGLFASLVRTQTAWEATQSFCIRSRETRNSYIDATAGLRDNFETLPMELSGELRFHLYTRICRLQLHRCWQPWAQGCARAFNTANVCKVRFDTFLLSPFCFCLFTLHFSAGGKSQGFCMLGSALVLTHTPSPRYF
jgi:hypothetical protein